MWPVQPKSIQNPNRATGARPLSQYSNQAAAPKCLSSRQRAATWPWSSSQPIAATSAPAPHSPTAAGNDTAPSAASTGSPARKVTTTATPPPRGVGTSWELRALGTSRMLRDTA